METKTMMIESEEGLMTWCKSTGSGVRLQKRGAKIIFDYLTGHGKMLSTNNEGELFLNDDVLTEKTTIDDVVDLVCEWNYEALSDVREKKENPDDFLDYCRSCTLERTLEEHKSILDRIFQQTIYGKDVRTIAHKLAMEMMKDMQLVPIYDIPITDELGAYSKVSEKSEYPAEEREEVKPVKDAEPERTEDIAGNKEEVPEAVEVEEQNAGEMKTESEKKPEASETGSDLYEVPEHTKEQGRSR